MKIKEQPTKDIQAACAWIYQAVAYIFFDHNRTNESEQIKVMDILSAIASGDKIPHKKFWKGEVK